jgi:uncharacterized protein YjbI with pentapeptide repeats/beta-lactamase regulating signal transducer with metallopeptidase domain
MTELPQGFVTVVSALSATALNALWQDALLVASIWLLLRLWPRINAATRYTVWSATLIAAFIIPIATTLAFFAAPHHLSAAPERTVASNVQLKSSVAHTAATVQRRAGHALVASHAPARLPERLRLTLSTPVALAVFAAWLLLATYALVRLIVGLVRLEQLKRDALPLPVEYREAMPQWTRANKGARDVRLCVSDETDVPVAVGLFDAMILVPHTLLDRLSQGEVDQICLHELAHLRRADDWTNGFQRLIIALLGWNPAAAFIGQQLDLEREVACDDWVLSFVGMVRPYALCLTKMAERASWPRHPIPAPGVFATRKHISLRIERLLGAGRNIATNLSPAPAAAAIAAVGALALLITVVAPSVAAPYVSVSTPAIAESAPKALKTPETRKSAAPVQVKTRTVVREARVAPVVVERAAPRPFVVSMPATSFTVPRIDAKRMAQLISRQVAESVSAATGSSRIAQSAHNCSGCDFSGVDWSGRDMHGVNYIGADFSKARLAGTNFSGGNFNGADFSKADLRNASFRGAHLTGCDFSGANLTGVDFRGARISGSQFSRAQLTATALRDVLDSCSGCDFSHANLRGLNLSNVRASGDDFSGADLSGVNFSGANLTGIDFANARLDGANLAGATLNGCDLDGVDLAHVDLSRTKLVGTDFSRDKPPE